MSSYVAKTLLKTYESLVAEQGRFLSELQEVNKRSEELQASISEMEDKILEVTKVINSLEEAMENE